MYHKQIMQFNELQLSIYILLLNSMLNLQPNRKITRELPNLIQRYDRMATHRNTFVEFLNKTQQLNCKFTQIMRPQLQNIQTNLHKKSLFSGKKIEPMLIFINSFNELLSAVEQKSKKSLSEIFKITMTNPKMSEKIAKKADTLNKTMEDYTMDIKSYNKKYGEYEVNCNKLEDMMKKSDNCDGAIFYYKIYTDAINLKNIQKKYHECQSLEPSLINNLEVLQQKRKILEQNLKDLRDEYLAGLQIHMNTILDATKCLIYIKKDDSNKMARNTYQSNLVNQNNLVSSYINNTQNQFNGNQSQALLLQFDKFTNVIDNLSDGNDLKAVTTQCQKIKSKVYQQSEQFLNIQKLIVQQISNIITNIQKNDKQFENIEKQTIKEEISSFDYKCKKYFGPNIFHLIKVSEAIVENPIKIYNSVGKFLSEKERQLKRVIEEKQFELKNFKKNSASSSLLLQEKCQLVKLTSKDSALTSRQFANFKESTYAFVNGDKLSNKKFNQILNSIIQFIKEEHQINNIDKLLSKNEFKSTKNMLEQYEVQADIVNIIQADQRYDTLFHNDSLLPIQSSHFKSLLQKNKCSETKALIKKKANRKVSTVTFMQRSGCCGSDSKKIKNKLNLKAILIVNPKLKILGHITIDEKFINFVQRKSNPFTQKIQLQIPISQVRGYHKIRIEEQNQGLQVMTAMGPIKFGSEQSNLLIQHLEKNSISQVTKNQTLQEKNESFSPNRSSGQLSSFMRQNSSSIQYRINPSQSSNDHKLTKGKKLNQITQPLSLKQLSQRCRVFNCYSEKVTPVKASLLNNNKIIQYNYDDGLSRFLMRQTRECQPNEPNNKLIINIVWKVSFPQFPMLKSFVHSETVTASLDHNLTKITIIEKPRTQQHLYMKTKFYGEVQTMNKNLSDLIVKSTQKQGEVLIDQQIKQQIVSNSDLDFDETGPTKADSQVRMSR